MSEEFDDDTVNDDTDEMSFEEFEDILNDLPFDDFEEFEFIDASGMAKEEKKAFAKHEDIGKESWDAWHDRYKENTKLRKLIAKWSMIIITIWLFLVISLLYFNDLFSLKISDNVQITLLTTTTFNVLGIIYIVLKDLFNGKSESKIN